MTDDRLLDKLLDLVPDEAWLVDTRGVLRERPEVFGDAAGFVAVRDGGWLLVAFGSPDRDCFERALELARPRADLVATGDAAVRARHYLGDDGETAFVHALGAAGLARGLDAPPATLLSPRDSVDAFPDEIVREVEEARGAFPVGVTMAGAEVVSVCYPVLTTERYWDISIETLPAYRREGRAAAAFLRLEREMRPTGLEPVWGAVESNEASLALAAKLGFERVGEVWLTTLEPS